MRRIFVRGIVILISIASLAASRPPVFRPDGVNLPKHRISSRHALLAAKPDVLFAAPVVRPLGGNPPQIGVVRNLDAPYVIDATESNAGNSESTATIRSTGAARVRVRLADVSLPPGAEFEVSGVDGDSIAFGRELAGPDGEIWTPGVDGDTIVVSAPPGTRFTITDIAHTFAPAGTAAPACFTDLPCTSFPDRDNFSSSVAHITYVNGSSLYACSGGLINGPSGDRLFLTANHCISNQTEASSVELLWDFRSRSCGGSATGTGTTTNGAALLVTSATTDVTLLRVNSFPGQRWLMGWKTDDLAPGTTLRRISHPYDATLGLFPQTYSETTVNTTTSTCSSLQRPNFLYSIRSLGGTEGGSSGSPDIVDGGYIVGQLLGLCGPDPIDGCTDTSRIVDGSLRQSYALLQPYLNPQPTQCAACVSDAKTACAIGGRFKITIAWTDAPAKLSGAGSIIRYADNLPEVDPNLGPVTESVFFSFYSFAPKSIEALVRLINGHGINDKFWVFATGFTGAEYTVTIQDTKSCTNWTKTIPAGATNVVKDFNAFPL